MGLEFRLSRVCTGLSALERDSSALQLPSLKNLHVVVLGDLMLDRYWHGDAGRISPEAPVPIVAVRREQDCPGGAANVALNVASLGARCTLLGCVGRDAEGAALRHILEAAGVACDLVELDGWSTIQKVRVVSRQQQLLRSDFEAPLPGAAAEALAAKLPAHLPNASVLILSDYDKGTIAPPAYAGLSIGRESGSGGHNAASATMTSDLIAAARRSGVAIVVDPKFKPFGAYAGASLLKPNRQEFAAAVGKVGDVQTLGEKAQSLCKELDIGALVVTAGAEGMTVVDGGQVRHLPAHPVEVYDVTGAGDTAAAVLGVAAGLGWPPLDGARLANMAASLVVAKSGTASVSGPELAYAAAQAGADRGALSRDQLMLAVAAARQAGERIVFTNGCFDILHAGHVTYLEQARRLGDRLLVAVNDDASVARIKGPHRPINPLQRRMRVLAGLQSVDWVVGFPEDTPQALISQVRPDVLAKGGDYRRDQVVGADSVAAYGGKVEVLGLVEDCSTSAVLKELEEG